MNKVFQVFVSSTYADLEDERRRVSQTLAKAGYIPAGMELFPATDQQQLDYIKRVIDRSDYYVVIVGGRYGSLADDNVSFTEKEYEYALSQKIPVLALLHERPDKIEVGKTDKDESKAMKLQAFRNRLASGRMIDFWTEPQELCTKIIIAVANAVNLTPGIGWVRGDQAIDPKVLQEMERLRIENDELKKRIAQFESNEISFPEGLLGPDDRVDVEISFFEDKRHRTVNAKLSIRFIFESAYESMLLGEAEGQIGRTIALAYLERHFPSASADPEIPGVEWLRYHLEALGLINAAGREVEHRSQLGTSRRDYITWVITEKGRKYMSTLKAFRRDTDSAA